MVVIDVVDGCAGRPAEGRQRVEMRFAHLKIHHGFERMRLRGLSGARDEFHLAAIVQNLKTLALRTLGPPPNRRHA
jgi:Transposase DDE domain